MAGTISRIDIRGQNMQTRTLHRGWAWSLTHGPWDLVGNPQPGHLDLILWVISTEFSVNQGPIVLSGLLPFLPFDFDNSDTMVGGDCAGARIWLSLYNCVYIPIHIRPNTSRLRDILFWSRQKEKNDECVVWRADICCSLTGRFFSRLFWWGTVIAIDTPRVQRFFA